MRTRDGLPSLYTLQNSLLAKIFVQPSLISWYTIATHFDYCYHMVQMLFSARLFQSYVCFIRPMALKLIVRDSNILISLVCPCTCGRFSRLSHYRWMQHYVFDGGVGQVTSVFPFGTLAIVRATLFNTGERVMR